MENALTIEALKISTWMKLPDTGNISVKSGSNA